jgi:hypothetical protein
MSAGLIVVNISFFTILACCVDDSSLALAGKIRGRLNSFGGLYYAQQSMGYLAYIRVDAKARRQDLRCMVVDHVRQVGGRDVCRSVGLSSDPR